MNDNTGPAASAETRRLAVIMFTDIVGFSRQMGVDEAHTLHLLGLHNQLIHQAVAAHHGVVIKTVGDAFLVSLNGDFVDIVTYSPSMYGGIIALQVKDHPEVIPQLMHRLIE